MTTQEIMDALGITASYDTTKPQPWLDMMAQDYSFSYEDLRTNYVWLYDEGYKLSGRPFNYMAAYARLLLKEPDFKEGATFYDKWEEGAKGYTNLGGFHTKLMELYMHGDSRNRLKLIKVYPEYFIDPVKQ